MKIQLASDLHLEFLQSRWLGERLVAPVPGADVLVLAGDIADGARVVELFAHWPTPVIYVAGNHEFYGHAIDTMCAKMREAATLSGIHFLENESLVIGGVRFLGTTLWTDYRLRSNRTQSELTRTGRVGRDIQPDWCSSGPKPLSRSARSLRVTRERAAEFQFIGSQLRDCYLDDFGYDLWVNPAPLEGMIRLRIGEMPRGTHMLWLHEIPVEFDRWAALDVDGMLSLERDAKGRREAQNQKAMEALNLPAAQEPDSSGRCRHRVGSMMRGRCALQGMTVEPPAKKCWRKRAGACLCVGRNRHCVRPYSTFAFSPDLT